VSWQIVPSALPKMLQGADAEKSNRVINAIMQMDKLDVEGLKQAYEQA